MIELTEQIRVTALCRDVLVVAVPWIDGTWSAYIGSVPGQNHDNEWPRVKAEGCKVEEKMARLIFDHWLLFKERPYAH